ncbi:hypothetical protein H2199_002535 [Coniosporium tulheliwenetii]|uniref:Uncharacterized protein n=1 Tax=Coniosporium tulheliwenetii TaxID=3383036 RepID=A0ACC2ZFD0_9PEZI|nr:hypothetical protein H2199_002535 [Cladosporium sp. JES 115]
MDGRDIPGTVDRPRRTRDDHPPDSDTPLVPAHQAAAWASTQVPPIPYTTEVSALSGDGVAELFHKLATIILTRIELGEIDPDDPRCGIQYGDAYGEDAWSVKSGPGGGVGARRRRGGTGGGGWMAGAREWEEVFRAWKRIASAEAQNRIPPPTSYYCSREEQHRYTVVLYTMVCVVPGESTWQRRGPMLRGIDSGEVAQQDRSYFTRQAV